MTPPKPAPTGPLLRVADLRIGVRVGRQRHDVVRGLSFDVNPGETVAIVGESGCGKSITALAILGLLPRGVARAESGSIFFEGSDLLRLPESRLSELRGNRIAMVFQEPMTSLNPVLTVGYQIAETIRRHRSVTRRAARDQAIAALERVRIPDPARRARMYPHQLSGGMRQRVMIAMALACRPRLIIADEPTTALDVTIQAQILALLAEIQQDVGTAILLITHDLGVVSQTADRVVVLYAGCEAESATTVRLFDAPVHPYTRGLMASIPRRALQAGADRLHEIRGVVPPAGSLPGGCAFAPRCGRALQRCSLEQPPLTAVASGHRTACWNPAVC